MTAMVRFFALKMPPQTASSPVPAVSSSLRNPGDLFSAAPGGQTSYSSSTCSSSRDHFCHPAAIYELRYRSFSRQGLERKRFRQRGLRVGVGVACSLAGARAQFKQQSERICGAALISPLFVDYIYSKATRHVQIKQRPAWMAAARGGDNSGASSAPASLLLESTTGDGDTSERGPALALVTYEGKDGQNEVGLLRGNFLWNLQEALNGTDGNPVPQISDMNSFINHWDEVKDRLRFEGDGKPLAQVRLLAPIPRPTGVIMCIGKNYLDHVKEVDRWKSAPGISLKDTPKDPIVFTKAPQSVVGPGAGITYPHGVSSAVDYEAELAVVIGKAGRNIKRDDAMSYVFGYTIINDLTARDLQKRHQQWFLGKSCDTFCPMGPGIVPASEVDGNNLQIRCWVNEELRQDGRTSQMIFGIPQLIEVISAATTIYPGDIIATGTPAGVGSGFDPPRHLVPGDKIRIQIEGIGELSNQVE